MATGPARDEEHLASGLTEWLDAFRPERGHSQVEVRHATVGYSNETLLVDVTWPDGVERLVVRLPPLVPSYPAYDLHAQRLVQNHLRDAGFPAPSVLAVEDDHALLGAPFLVMEYVDGTVVGQVPGLDEWLTDAPLTEQQRVQHRFVDTLAQLHRTAWSGTAVEDRLRHGVGEEIGFWRTYTDWAADGSPAPALVDAIEWCHATMPATEPPAALLWGDARFGNVVFTDHANIAAVLDWELATIGPAEMDVAWFLALETLTSKATATSVPGFDERERVLARYESALGRSLADLAWHEIFALVRSIAINDKLARLAAASGTEHLGFGDENPMLPYVARRIERFEAP